ncbi:uncharacterized protein LOC122791337 [Protopterus annectens]|uniref:uncharacterized protein LOC122791337 n=1 Tax=Protopterus annectens TaxID=7888 RepID=UPI001CF97EC3|nr:uncharacterized protein LOC122791337 [Protopterus annectens]
MGVYASTFHNSGGQILLESTDPSQSNWITAHAKVCKMSIPEAQRCWSRFLMLQPDKDGNIPRNRLCTDSPFSQQLLEQLPVTRDGLLTFQTYCSALSWLSKSGAETKLRGLFQVFASTTLDQEALQNLLQNVYPDKSAEEMAQLSIVLLRNIDETNQGFINEDHFTAWVLKLPQDIAESALWFPLIPKDVGSPSHPQSVQKSATPVPASARNVTDEHLMTLASEMTAKKRDWKLLANNLGFLESDCHTFGVRFREKKDQILEMLQVWKNTTGERAQVSALQAALRDSGNVDISNKIFQLDF